VSGDEESPGARIARARRRTGLSQSVLAGLVGRSESWLHPAAGYAVSHGCVRLPPLHCGHCPRFPWEAPS
jgi:hypothetical protein